MRKLLFLVLAIGVPLSMVVGEATKASKQERLRAVDSFAAADTVETTIRTNADTSNVYDVRDWIKFSFVYATEFDTTWTNDTLFFILHYSVDQSDVNLWIVLDTIKKSLAADTAYSAIWYRLDSLPPMNYIRIEFVHRDALESSADNVGLFENVYNTDGYIWLKGWK